MTNRSFLQVGMAFVSFKPYRVEIKVLCYVNGGICWFHTRVIEDTPTGSIRLAKEVFFLFKFIIPKYKTFSFEKVFCIKTGPYFQITLRVNKCYPA